MKRKIAIAGLGAAARQIHLPAYAKLPDLEVVGGCDPAVGSGAYSFPLFSSTEEMLKQAKPDILAVVTPPDSHFELTRLALLSGCHVFCEKPFTNTLEEAEQLITLSKRLARWIVVNNQFRFMKIHREAKKRIGRPEFGELLFVTAHQTFRRSETTEAGWRGQDPQRTCKEFGIHVIDLCRFFFGEDPGWIDARMPQRRSAVDPDYLDIIQLGFSGNRVAHILLDRLCLGRHRYLDMRLDGTAGCVETHLGGNFDLRIGTHAGSRKPYIHADVSMGGYARIFHGEKSSKIASDPINIFAAATRRLLRSFLDALNESAVPPCNGQDNRRSLAVTLAAYESHNRQRPIEMRYD